MMILEGDTAEKRDGKNESKGRWSLGRGKEGCVD